MKRISLCGSLLVLSTLAWAVVTESTYATRPAPGKVGNTWRQDASQGPLRCVSDGTDWLCEAYGVSVAAEPVPTSGWDVSLASGSTIDFTSGVGRITIPGGTASWLPILHPLSGPVFDVTECVAVSKPQGIVAAVLATAELDRFIYSGQAQAGHSFTQYYAPQNTFRAHLTGLTDGSTGQILCFGASRDGEFLRTFLGPSRSSMALQSQVAVTTPIGPSVFIPAYFGVVFYRYGFPFDLNAELFHWRD